MVDTVMKQSIVIPKRIVRIAIESIWLAVGLTIYALTRKTLESSWQSAIYLFCASRGRSSEVIHSLIKVVSPPDPIVADGFLGKLSSNDLKLIAATIEKNGYYVSPTPLPPELCDRVLEYALSAPYSFVNDTRVATFNFQRGKPGAVRYTIAESDLIQNELIQRLLGDRSFLAVAQAYLGSSPIMDLIGLWWTTDFSQKPNARAATMYHFDMTRIRWLNFFINMTDVNVDSGPHTFIEGSHRPGGIPGHFLDRGYVRIPDDEVESWYPRERVKEFVTQKGTILIEDTRGLHKAKPVRKGDRLLFQISYVDCLFGGKSDPCKFEKITEPSLLELTRSRPRLFSRYL